MRISEVTQEDLAEYLKLPVGSFSAVELESVMSAARAYIEGYTGISVQPCSEKEKCLDDYEDLTMAYLILCQDLYDNRTAGQDSAAVNRTLETILGMHRRNLICE